MTRTSESAGVWIRVSSGGQDEQNQVPDVERHCAAHGYTVAERYELNDKSASKGEQQHKLDEMLHDMRDGKIAVLVCWHSDRVERRGPEALFSLLRQIKDAGGRIESTQEPLLGTEDLTGEAVTAIGAVIAHQYTVHLAEQVRLAHERIRANGAVGPGGNPWGYKTTGKKYNKQLIPTDLCREYAPLIFDRAIAGKTYREIGAWLDSEGVPPKKGGQWHEGSVRKLIRNRVYAGRWQNGAKTLTTVRCEAVVSADVWERANAATNRRPNRQPVSATIRPMLADLRCARCDDSPMNRIRIKDRYGKYYTYYRCTGRGARRKGCGNMILLEPLERFVRVWTLIVSDKPHQVRTWVEGTNWDAEIADTKQDMREAVEAEDFDRMPELRARLENYRNREVIRGRWEYEDTGLTVGQYFASLDDDGKREYLRRHDIRAEKTGKAPQDFRVVIDGDECDRERFDTADLAYAAKTGRMPSLWPEGEPFPVP